MIKTILVPATGSEADSAAFGAAAAVARQFGAHLDFLHVRTDPAEIAAAMSADIAGPVVVGNLVEELEKEAERREEEASRQFQRFCEAEGVVPGGEPGKTTGISAEWHRETGRESAWVIEYARACDLLVVGRQLPLGVHETLEAALLDSGRPLLIPPSKMPAKPGAPGFETVAIAWKSTREAARAAAAALPFLKEAKKVVVLTVEEDGSDDVQSAARLVAGLKWHRIEATLAPLGPVPGGTAVTLLAACERSGADLLVIGGYGHSRLREMVFGGVTATVLQRALLPVLMTH